MTTTDAPIRTHELSEELLEGFRARAGELDRTNTYLHDDLAELRDVGYLAAVVPVHHGGWGLDVGQMAASQRRLARYAPATALAGGLLGCLAVLPLNGLTTGTINWQTFSHLAFAFRITPVLLMWGLLFALLMGLVGGLPPAVRASRAPIVIALREL